MRRVQTNFRAEDFRSDGDSAPAEKKAAPAPAPESDEVPQGTSAEIMAWVGDDKDRAQRALDAENANDRPRKTLVSQLEGMTGE